MSDDRSVAEAFGLDDDPERGHAAVPLDLELLAGQTVIVYDGVTREPAVVAVDPALFARDAWQHREGERIVRIWQRGNLTVWSAPVQRGAPAMVEITDEEGVTRLEEITWPIYDALATAMRQRQRGDGDA